jgi:hypothetical protein
MAWCDARRVDLRYVPRRPTRSKRTSPQPFFYESFMRTSGLPDEILNAVVERIRSQVPELNNAGRCFLALNPQKAQSPTTGDFFCVVAPASGVFQREFFEGGGQQQATVESTITATIFSTSQLDPALRDAIFLTGTTRGIFKVATKLLKALADWSPQISEREMTRDPLVPLRYSIARSDRGLGSIELEFKVTFDWNLQ